MRQLRSGKILTFLISRAGLLCSAKDIADALGSVSSGTVKVYMSELRAALSRAGMPDIVHTEWREGYWISPQDAGRLQSWLERATARLSPEPLGGLLPTAARVVEPEPRLVEVEW